jgi:DNA-binding beta-propeller fold protein YncE
LGQSGIDPPVDQIFLPGGLAVDTNGNWLYVVNSNNDLRFNAGTLLAIDLQKAKGDRERQPAAVGLAAWPPCSRNHFTDDTAPESLAATLDEPCCFDLLRPHALNCNERAYAQADATVQIGSFGGEAAIQANLGAGGEPVDRVFMMVRAEPSITFVDVTHANGSVQMRCTGSRQGADVQPGNPFCDDNWRVRRPGGSDVSQNVFPEEPHAMVLDEALGILYVGHLTFTVNRQLVGGGVSTIDVNALRDPAAPNGINSIARVVFPTSTSQSVTALTLSAPGDPKGVLYAVARSSADISGLVLQQCQEPGQMCDVNNPARELSLIPGEQIASSVFSPWGVDVRGFLLSPDGNQAYVLHRNTPESTTSSDPAALVVLDRPSNRPSAILEVCSGPTHMQFHDAGRGSLLIFITCFEGGQIYVVDPVKLLVVAIIEAGHGPTALTFSPADPTTAFVADYADNNVSVIDLAPGSPTEYMVVQRLGFPHTVTQ